MRRLRIGFLSTANIGRKNWKAVFHSGNAVVSAVASRDPERARRFVQECQAQAPFETAPAAFGDYADVLASREVDAVYIPLPTGRRKEWVVRAAQARKHVLCEKPCAIRTADLGEMIAACKKSGVQFMDGVMFMHNRRLERIREALGRADSIGPIKRITSQFSFAGSEEFLRGNIRAQSDLEPLGCLGDLGWYCIRFALWALRWQLPRRIEARALSQTQAGVPLELSAELIFDGGVSSGFYCSFLTVYRQWADVSGVKGHLRVPDFVLPAAGSHVAFEVNGHLVKTDESAPAQDVSMICKFANQVLSGELNDEWPMWALKTQQVTDACYEAARRNGGVEL
ncbi:MAG: Gfo/Idh/MocA family oxidoreductase [Verrucomicrobiota bacterium]|nr:Gfo/Idh/MocA family oxidoreductase [Verrucomicrobiota bacterium]